jgi:hypothetical protein
VLEGIREKFELTLGGETKAPPLAAGPAAAGPIATAPDATPNDGSLVAWLQKEMSQIVMELLKLDAGDVSPDKILLDLGFDSIGLLEPAHEVGKGVPARSIFGLPIYTVVASLDNTAWLGPEYTVTAEHKSGEPAPAAAEGEATGFIVVPFLRGASTDLNMTLALALIAMTMTQVYGLQALGPSYLTKFFTLPIDEIAKNPMKAIDRRWACSIDLRTGQDHLVHLPSFRQHVRRHGAHLRADDARAGARCPAVLPAGDLLRVDPGAGVRHADPDLHVAGHDLASRRRSRRRASLNGNRLAASRAPVTFGLNTVKEDLLHGSRSGNDSG